MDIATIKELRICSKNGECFSSNITFDQWSDIEISQHPEEEMYRHEVKVDGVVIASMLTEHEEEFEDVRFFASDPWHDSSEGIVKDVTIVPYLEKPPSPDTGNFVVLLDLFITSVSRSIHKMYLIYKILLSTLNPL